LSIPTRRASFLCSSAWEASTGAEDARLRLAKRVVAKMHPLTETGIDLLKVVIVVQFPGYASFGGKRCNLLIVKKGIGSAEFRSFSEKYAVHGR
jgi:hypothetical protein